MATKPIRTDELQDLPYGPEHDSCALYLSARKNGQSTFGTLKRALWRLANMGHRTGYVKGEGDGAGVQTDIPRGLWAKKLSQASLPASLATQPGFWVGHLFTPYEIEISIVKEIINRHFANAELNLLLFQPGPVTTEALGLNAQVKPPSFWQLVGSANPENLEKRLFAVKLKLEEELPIHFASLSSFTVIYKMRGSVETLARYYPELQDRSYDTVMALCHARYSTNTVSTFERAQPFALLGHNGEINTISQFRLEARQIGVQLPKDGSDSQDVDRALENFCIDRGLSLMEAMEIIFPPSPHEINNLPPPLSEIYSRLTQAYGPFAQGPAAIAARYADTAICSLDTLGLRPLWFSETEKEYIFSSERGAIQLEDMVTDSRPFSPGEKMGLIIHRGKSVDVLSHRDIRQHVMKTTLQRDSSINNLPFGSLDQFGVHLNVQNQSQANQIVTQPNRKQTTVIQTTYDPKVLISLSPEKELFPWYQAKNRYSVNEKLLTSAGWNTEQIQEVVEQAEFGLDPVGSMGFDGPLAALSKNRVNLADYFKETVAVVTNPAVDRSRECEAFSTRTLVGTRPEIGLASDKNEKFIMLDSPILSGGHPDLDEINLLEEVANQTGVLSIEELACYFEGTLTWLSLSIQKGQSVQEALGNLAQTAVDAIKSGAICLVLDDTDAISAKRSWLDPLLATAAVDNALRISDENLNLRRKAGIVVRSASIRNLHDIILLCSFGADAINPYAMLATPQYIFKTNSVDRLSKAEYQTNILKTLRVGLEKVISTIGCHELRGYGRVSSSIGLAPEISTIFQTPNFLGSNQSGVNWAYLEKDSIKRTEELQSESSVRMASIDRLYPKFWKTVGQYANGQIEYQEISNKYRQLIRETPIALRHIIQIKTSASSISPSQVDLAINGYDLPFIIAAMSFGSQGELSFKAYAHAAKKLNIICINGEGGEIPEVFGKYKRNRGQQVASARFGVNAAFLNSCGLIEIKIGQGAKPGEGGMLPAEKVNPKVAEARHTPPYVSLLSPSNNHDLYSIEDLAQLIEELKTVNPEAKISVKCPCVPGIGVIAVGVAKAGADIINLSGYDGATGAARKHAIQYVGLPAEIGVVQAHRALVDAGIRNKVEIWCDGGMKTGEDVVKMVLLGANRVGFASMVMVAIGCTICRKCNEGTCHAGITTHIKSTEEAQKLGLKNFNPGEYNSCVDRIVHLFTGIESEVRQLTDQLGANKLQDLVGKADLLEQYALNDRIDLSPMLAPVPVASHLEREPGVGRLLTRDRNQLTRFISESVLEAIDDGEKEVTYQDQVMAYDRALGSHLFGALMRQPQINKSIDKLHLHFGPSSIGGNGFAAWVTGQMDVLIEGGAQDGVAKGASGGRVAIMKGLNHDGLRIDGSVGKSFAYGAQKGVLIVQGNADSRACIRLSGADVILGGQISHPIDGSTDSIGTTANLKGFACEYMTSGRVIIFGDPGLYAFSGMTGGVVYQLLTPEMGFNLDVLKSRVGKGAYVKIVPLEEQDIEVIQELLNHYLLALIETNQSETAEKIGQLCLPQVAVSRFVKVIPKLSVASPI
jgi:glutamate synthase (NADPH/NADH) large chain